jgi:formyltetrahydrofolate-dependent phosphoribosylglycinamide formyltransferase
MSINVAILLSGGGTTLQNILDLSATHQLDAKVVCVASSRTDAYGLTRAEKAGVPNQAFPRKGFDSVDSFGKAIWAYVDGFEPDLIVLAGFMSLLPVPQRYSGRIMNVHPALIPSFCGQGMYGHHVHQAVLEYGAKLSGVTVHFVDEQYDNGPIIAQSAVPVHENDTADSLAERIQAEERNLYPKVIQMYAEGRLKLVGRQVHISPKAD